MAKGGKKKGKPKAAARAARDARARLDPARERQRLTIMMASAVFVVALGWVFALHHFLPQQAARTAEEAVRQEEAKVLEVFEERAARQGIQILGWESQVFPRITLVTYVYTMPGSPDRKAFWWAYLPASGEVHRVGSVQEFVDEYLLPTVDQLHHDMTGVPGPLALERHVEKT